MLPSVFSRLFAFALSAAAASLAPTLTHASPVFNGGPTISAVGGADVYYIWYRDWTNNSATTLLPDLLTNLSGATHMNILSSYGLSNQVDYSGSYFISSSPNSCQFNIKGNNLVSADSQGNIVTTDIYGIVQDALATNAAWKLDPNAVFDVLQGTLAHAFVG